MSITKKLKEIDKKYPLKHTNNFFDNLIIIVGVVCMFLGGYCLLDNYNVYNQVTALQKLGFKPEVTEDKITFSDVPLAKAWLSIPDTQIDYPIMQGKDNLEYINKDCFGKYALAGSIFVDFKNKEDFSDSYNILYGHHMDKGMMFGSLDKWNDETFFKEHKIGYLLTKEKVYKVTFLRLFEADANDKNVFSLDMTNSERGLDDKKYIALTTCKVSTDTRRTVLLGEMEEISTDEYRRVTSDE